MWKNRTSIRKSTMKINILHITWKYCRNDHINVTIRELLRELHFQKFYQRLHVTLNYRHESEDLRLITSCPGLESFFGYQPVKGIVPCLTNLKEIQIEECHKVRTTEMLNVANNLPNLEKLTMTYCEFDYVLPFIQCCPKLK